MDPSIATFSTYRRENRDRENAIVHNTFQDEGDVSTGETVPIIMDIETSVSVNDDQSIDLRQRAAPRATTGGTARRHSLRGLYAPPPPCTRLVTSQVVQALAPGSDVCLFCTLVFLRSWICSMAPRESSSQL